MEADLPQYQFTSGPVLDGFSEPEISPLRGTDWQGDYSDRRCAISRTITESIQKFSGSVWTLGKRGTCLHYTVRPTAGTAEPKKTRVFHVIARPCSRKTGHEGGNTGRAAKWFAYAMDWIRNCDVCEQGFWRLRRFDARSGGCTRMWKSNSTSRLWELSTSKRRKKRSRRRTRLIKGQFPFKKFAIFAGDRVRRYPYGNLIRLKRSMPEP